MMRQQFGARHGVMRRIGRLATLLVASWSVMSFTHEAGHVLGGWCCGGTLQAADLWPWHLPYSLFDPDPRPLVTLWSGLVLGATVPLAIAGIVRREGMWFVAYFCLLANGTYVVTGWFSGEPYLDTPRLLDHGASPMTIAAYAIGSTIVGYLGFRRALLCIWRSPIRSTDCEATDCDASREETTASSRNRTGE